MATVKVIPHLAAFLDLIAWCEGTDPNPFSKDHGYDVIKRGITGPNIFTDYSIHPFARGRAPICVRGARAAVLATPTPTPNDTPKVITPALTALHSTASGRYQINLKTWVELSVELKLGIFSPANQDLAALELMKQRGADKALLAGLLPDAIGVCKSIWASFPGNNYGEGSKFMVQLLTEYPKLLARTLSA